LNFRRGPAALFGEEAPVFAGCVAYRGLVPVEHIADLGLEIFPRDRQTPEALGALHKAEIEKWWPIIKAANIKAQ
jgi:hypothetical protein